MGKEEGERAIWAAGDLLIITKLSLFIAYCSWGLERVAVGGRIASKAE